MKIPPDRIPDGHRQNNPLPGLDQDGASAAARKTDRTSSFGLDAGSAKSKAAVPLFALKPEWKAADLKESSNLQEMLRDGVQQMVNSSAVTKGMSPEARSEVERVLVADPTVRDLITQHLQQSLA